MSVNVTMPALSPTMTTGTLAKWTIGIGDAVQTGDVIAEIETDKATMEVEAIEDGVITQILVEAGTESVAVGTVIAVLAEMGESVDEVASTAVAPVQSSGTQQAAQAMLHFLNYAAAHPGAEKICKASDMMLSIGSDAACLAALEARSGAGGYH